MKTPVEASKFIPNFLDKAIHEKSRDEQLDAKNAFKARLAAAKGPKP